MKGVREGEYCMRRWNRGMRKTRKNIDERMRLQRGTGGEKEVRRWRRVAAGWMAVLVLAQSVLLAAPVMAKERREEPEVVPLVRYATPAEAERLWEEELGMAEDLQEEEVMEKAESPYEEDESGVKEGLREERESEAMSERGYATPSDAEGFLEEKEPEIAAISSSVGDLWEFWNSRMDFPGDGTRESPYQIDSLSRLMGLSEAVAAGEDYEGQYFELTQDIHLQDLRANNGNWNPIGWYQNRSEMGGSVRHPFRGHLDGAGNRITGLRIVDGSQSYTNLGLFGVIDGGSVKNLTVEAEDLIGEDCVAALAGTVLGPAVISQVTVSGFVESAGDAGGIAAVVTGAGGSGSARATIENCRAEGIVLNSEGPGSYVGGIAGNVQRAWLVDNTVITQDGDSNRIRGKGYVGGIAGRMVDTDIFNSYVNGTVGGNGSRAAGGIVGQYVSGDLVLARMAGDIAATHYGSASREGTFVGTRESRDRFTYGTEKDSNFSYLFARDAVQAKAVMGSTIDGDNTFTREAHIGYWTDQERKYVTVAGRTETESGERYFYEELEDAVRYLVTRKLERNFTWKDYGRGLPFCLDHFAPGYMGAPVRGYLVSVPRIDARNHNGTYDTDVAELTAVPAAGNPWYRTIDKDHAAAVVPGTVVTVATAPKNTGGSRYQMVVDGQKSGGVKPPSYRDEDGNRVEMEYQNGGSYSFVMPESDTELSVEYVRVTTRLTLDPEQTSIHVVQTRSGDRKNPRLVTEVTNQEGVLIARYIENRQDTTVQAQPVTIHGEHNGVGLTADRTIKWSVDDTNLLTNLSDAGYTLRDAAVMPNLSSRFIQEILNREVQAQADNRYQEKINNTIYTRRAVVTGTANPDTSADNRAVYANCRVDVTFQILDNTTVRVEGMRLNRDRMEFTVTRRLTGDRLRPQETFLCSEPVVLTAALNPERPFFKNVSWRDRESGRILSLTPSGNHTQDCRLAVRMDPSGKDNPAWIQNMIREDKEKRRADPYRKSAAAGQYTERVEAISEDQTHGHVTAACDVVIHFVTRDETVIRPERVTLDKKALSYELSYDYAGRIRSAIRARNGFGSRDRLVATVAPALGNRKEYQPYDRTVVWTSSDPSAVRVESGQITVLDDAPWIREALRRSPYRAEKTVILTARTRDKGLTDECRVRLSFRANVRKGGPGGGSRGGSGGGSGGGSQGGSGGGTRGSSGGGSGGGSKGSLSGGTWGGAGGKLGGGPGSGSGGPGQVTFGGMGASSGNDVPKGPGPRSPWPSNPPASFESGASNPVQGNWLCDEQGNWKFSAGGRSYANEWAAIVNPYAHVDAGQKPFDWFCFGTDGRMLTGWHWLPASDGKICCYYFNEKPDGTRGALVRAATTPDGYQVNEQGQWTEAGVVMTRK